jgi:hypothetical protein
VHRRDEYIGIDKVPSSEVDFSRQDEC